LTELREPPQALSLREGTRSARAAAFGALRAQ